MEPANVLDWSVNTATRTDPNASTDATDEIELDT